MALDPAQRAAATRSAWGHLGRDFSRSDVDIVRDITRREGWTDPSNTLSTLNAVRAARRAMVEAQQANSGPSQDSPLAPRGRDNTIDDGGGNFRYRVIVQVTDPDTLTAYDTVVVIDSTVALTPRQVKAEALAAFSGDTSLEGRYTDRGPVSAGAAIELDILTAGRK